MGKLVFFAVLSVQLMMATADDGLCPANEERRCGPEYTCEYPCIKGPEQCRDGCAAPPWPCFCKRGFVRYRGKCRSFEEVCELH